MCQNNGVRRTFLSYSTTDPPINSLFYLNRFHHIYIPFLNSIFATCLLVKFLSFPCTFASKSPLAHYIPKFAGVPAELAAKMCAAVPTVDVTHSATGVTLVATAGDKTFPNAITFGQDSPSEIAGLTYTVSID